MGPHDHEIVQLRISALGVDIIGGLRGGLITFQAPPGSDRRTGGKYDCSYRIMQEDRSWHPWIDCRSTVRAIDGFKPSTMPFLQAMVIDDAH